MGRTYDMKSIDEIRAIYRTHEREIQENYRIKQIGIFGSYVRGDQREGSDIDILVEFDEPLSLLGIVKAENYLSELLRMKVDLVPKADLRPELKEAILETTVYI